MTLHLKRNGPRAGINCTVNPISLQWSLNVSQLIAPRLRMYCYSSIDLSQLLAAWAQRLPTLLKLAIGLAGYRVDALS